MDQTLQAYVELWSEPDADRREALVRACLSEDAEIIGPRYRFKGRRAVLDEVARFLRTDPGFRPVLTSGFDAHDGWVRFTFALLDPAGRIVNEGWDLVELDGDGRIARVISFWGPLPPVPHHFPERVLFPPNHA
jgi:hypothetical protein